MKRIGQLTLVMAVVAMAAVPALAQERQRQRPGTRSAFTANLYLLNQKSVQEELKLSEEQVKKVKELTDKRREMFGKFREAGEDERKKIVGEFVASEKAFTDSLKPEQLKRLKQISLQRQGPRAFSDAEVASALNLTDEQKQKMKEIQDKASEERRGRPLGDRSEEARKKREELRKSVNEKLMAVLTAEQKAKWKELTGEPFKGEITRPQTGGRNRSEGQSRHPGR